MLKASHGALELSWDAARWWGGALANGAVAARDENERLLGGAAERLVGRFRGRIVELELGGERVRGTFESLRLRSGEPGQAILVLRDVRWRGFVIDSLGVLAERAAIAPLPDLGLAVSGVRLRARLGAAALLARAGQELPRWRLEPSDRGQVEARSASGCWRFVLEPVRLAPECTVELRELCWRRLRLRVPHWLRLSRRVPLPELPAGLGVIDARWSHAGIELVLSVPPIIRQLRLREAGTS